MVLAGAITTRHGLMKTPSGRRASSCSRYIAHREGKLAEILAAYDQHVEGAELNFFFMLARRECVEIRDDLDIERDGLATENDLPEILPCTGLGPSVSVTALVGMSNLSEAKTQIDGRGCAADRPLW
jgi:hypothetical protein